MPRSTFAALPKRQFALLILSITVLAAACGGSSTKAQSPAASPTSVPASSSPTSAPAPVATTSAASPSDGNAPPAGNASVHFGQSSLVALTDFNTQKTNTIKLTISVVPGTLSDLKNFDLDAQTKKGTPFYLSYSVANLSQAKVDTSGFAGLLTVDTASGDEASILTLAGDFPKCQGDAPDSLAPGVSAQGCDVFVLPAGETVATVSIDNGDAGKITWS
jgi:ABC-type glycerol-3-phosphate transport system substrate-binding protein